MRYADTDASGAVHHATYLTYFEAARVEALRGLGVPVRELAARGVMMPVVEARLVYLRPARLDELLEVAVLLDRIGPASFSFDYEVLSRRAAARHRLDAHGGDRARRAGAPSLCRTGCASSSAAPG